MDPTHYVRADTLREASTHLKRAVEGRLAQRPALRGVAVSDLRRESRIEKAIFDRALRALIDDGRLRLDDGCVAPPGHAPRLPQGLEAATRRIEQLLSAAGFEARRLDDLASVSPTLDGPALRHAVDALIASGRVVEIDDGFLLHVEGLERAKRLVSDAIRLEGPITMSRLKDVLGTSRKYAMPIAEYLDRRGYTRRTGDLRARAGGE